MDLEITLSDEPDDDTAAGPAELLRADLVVDLEEDRYSRLRLIPWWDQERLRQARVLVVGAGALGNEILKNLALLGVGRIFVVDLDRIENSNLSRSVLYRAGDEGKPKAEVAAARVHELNPDVQVQAFTGNVITGLGLGVFRAVDVVLGGLDGREARLAVNEKCWHVGRPWVDGAIEVLFGVARVFVPPDGACYECTMNEADRAALAQRRSCALLTRGEMLEGKVPTTPTTASVIAGIQVQEAVKLLHHRPELPVLASRGFFFNGVNHDSYLVEYPRRDDCLSHFPFGEILEQDWQAASLTLGGALEAARARLGPQAVLEFDQDLVTSLRCATCDAEQPIFRALGAVTEPEARCPTCGELRAPETTHAVYGTEGYLDLTLAELGLPPFDIITGRSGLEMVHFELSGDRAAVLGSIA